jgi:uncharacterized protein
MSKIFLSAALLTTFTGLVFLSGGGCARANPDDGDVRNDTHDDPQQPIGRVSSALSDGGDDAGVKRGQIVISQVFGGGGNSGAPFNRDYVELFNRSSATVSLDGLSIQTASASADFTGGNVVALSGAIPAGGYYLIALDNGPVGENLPPPDKVSTETLGLTDGKVALVPGILPLGCGGSARCGKDKLLDLVGYGGSSDFEGSDKAPALDAAHAALRKNNGCTDADDNSKDFKPEAPNPRNSATALAPCPPSTQPGVDAGKPAPPVVDPPLGVEDPYDAGVRRDAGGKAGGSGSDSGGCAFGLSPDAGTPSTAFGLISGVVIVLSRRRRSHAKA